MTTAIPPSVKAIFRREALARRAGTTQVEREAFAERLAIEGVALVRRAMAGRVALYWPIGAEADPRLLMQALHSQGFETALPVTQGRGQPLVFRRWSWGDPLVDGPMKISEPSPRLPVVVPDLLFVPLAAFDRGGFRIGYGAGHYDATLECLRAMGPVPAIGIAFACQEIDRAPEEAHDQPLDFVLTERELIDCSPART